MQTKVLKNLQIQTERDELLLKFKKVKALNLIEETEISLNEKSSEDEETIFDFSTDFFKDIEAKNKFIKDFKERKIQFLKKSKEEAEKLKLKAIQEGEKKGYSEGLEKAKAEILEKFEENVNIIKRAHIDVNNRMQEIIKNSEKDILMLSIAVAEKIIREKIEENDEIVLNSLKFILKTVPQVNKVIIYFNPEEFERIKNSSSELVEIMERYKEVKFVDDARIEKGGVIVETELGNINGQPGSQIEKLKKVFGAISS